MKDVFVREGKSLGRYTNLGNNLNAEVSLCLKEILERYEVNPRDFGAICHSAVEDVVCEAVLAYTEKP